MGWFVTGVILLVLGLLFILIGWGVRSAGKRDDDRDQDFLGSALAGVATVVFLLGVLTIVLNTFTVIPARNVGIVVCFGKAEQALDNGGHGVKPWCSIETVDGTSQTITVNKDNQITVRLKNMTNAFVQPQVSWNIDNNSDANQVWQQYRGKNDDLMGNISNNVIWPALKTALGQSFETFDPLAALQAGKTSDVTSAQLQEDSLKKLRAVMPKGILITKLLLPNGGITFDNVTQDRLNAYAQEIASTQIAMQQKLTNEQLKLANDALAQASSNDPGVKYQNCLNLIRYLADKNQLGSAPQTFNCNDSDGTPVIVGQK